MKSLVEIFREQGTSTDKLTAHQYPYYYEELFAPIRESTTSILEIGIAWGGSLRAWREYFPNATIHGIDNERSFVHNLMNEGRVQPYLLDAGNATQLNAWFKGNKFDIIIDDGSKIATEIETAFSVLWDTLNPGGFYILEDVGCIHAKPAIKTFTEIVKSAIYNASDLASITFRPDMIILTKKRDNDPTCPPLGTL